MGHANGFRIGRSGNFELTEDYVANYIMGEALAEKYGECESNLIM